MTWVREYRGAAVSTVELVDVLTAGREMPEGCDRWAIRAVHPDLRSRYDYRYPWPGQWAVAPRPIETNDGECPRQPGDGLCAAHTWAGMTGAGIPSCTLLLVAYATADLLSHPDQPKIRLRRMYIVDVVDGARLIREHGTRANLRYANLRQMDLYRARLIDADLSHATLLGADLTGADLSRATMYDATLRTATLHNADLHNADLRDADLSRATMYGVNLSGADLSHATLLGADLTGADLRDADLSRANLIGANLTFVRNLADANLTGTYTHGRQYYSLPLKPLSR